MLLALLHCLSVPGHSKAGGEVILYASTYDDIPLVINVAGRFWMEKGITMRFGDDIFERTQQGPIAMPAQRDDGHTFTWLLTKEVRNVTGIVTFVTCTLNDTVPVIIDGSGRGQWLQYCACCYTREVRPLLACSLWRA
jgi:hypothetical protein